MARKRRKKWLFILVTLLGLYLLSEVISFCTLLFLANERNVVRSETHLFDAHRNHRLNPQFHFSKDPRSRFHSPCGFRSDREISRKKPDQTVRIIAMGTSALYGIGSNSPYPTHRPLYNNETITHHLEVILQKQLDEEGVEQRVEVINAGVSAYRTYHHLIYLNSDLLDYKPDIVINIDGHNDFYYDRLEDPWNTYAYSSSVLVDEFNRRTMFLSFFTLTRSLSRYSYTFNLLERICRRIWHRKLQQSLASVPTKEQPMSGDLKRDVEMVARRQYMLDLWQIHQLGQYAGYDHYIFLQPEVVFESNQLLSESDKKIKQITIEHSSPGEAEKKIQIRTMLPDIFRRYQIPFYDVSEISPQNVSRKDLYIDYCHLTPHGAQVTAEQISQHLFPKVLAKAKALQQAGKEIDNKDAEN